MMLEYHEGSSIDIMKSVNSVESGVLGIHSGWRSSDSATIAIVM